jgi:hypothetical protein
MLALPAFGQLGIKGGIHTTQINPEGIRITDPTTFQEFGLEVAEARFGFLIGTMLKIRMDKFFIQPEVVLNSNSTKYTWTDDLVTRAFEESYQYLDIPLMFGFDLGVLNLFGGPISHIFLSSTSELKNLEGFREDWDSVRWGWQAGMSFDIWRLNLDIRYEGNLYRFGDHLNFFGQDFNFDQRPNRIVTTVGLMLGR